MPGTMLTQLRFPNLYNHVKDWAVWAHVPQAGRLVAFTTWMTYLYAAGISSNRTTLPERDSHINFDLFSGHKRQVYKCCFPLCFFHFYLCFFLNCDLNSLWDSFHQARGDIAEVVYSFLTQLEGKGPWAPHNRAVWDTLACWLYKYYYLIKWS